MELDDQLAALVADELDDDTARALRARVAADPALTRRLAQHQRLQTLLSTWSAPPPSPDAITRIDAAVDAALADLDDGPLVDRAAPTGRPAAVPTRAATDEPTPPAPAPTPDGVVDLGAARAAREARRGLPTWLTGTAVAAALLAVVGIGAVLGGGGFGGGDDADIVADSASDDAAESDMAGADGAEESLDEEAAAVAPTTPGDLTVAEGDLLAVLDVATGAGLTAETDTDDAADGAGDTSQDMAEGAAEPAPDACVVEALERDTEDVDGREIAFLAAGTYDGQPARFVVVRSPGDGSGARYDVLAYDPGDCSLLERDTDVR